MKKLLLFIGLCSSMALQAMAPKTHKLEVAPQKAVDTIAAHFNANTLTEDDVMALTWNQNIDTVDKAIFLRDLLKDAFVVRAKSFLEDLKNTLNSGGKPTAAQKAQGLALLSMFEGMDDWEGELRDRNMPGFTNYEKLKELGKITVLNDDREFREALQAEQ